MKEKMLRLARFNQKWLGMFFLTLIYFLGLGPVAIIRKLGLISGFRRHQVGGWRKAPGIPFTLKRIEEQS